MDHHDRHYFRYQDHPRFGLSISFVPAGCASIWSRGERYYYYDGVYYNRRGYEYVVVAPPAGAIVRTLPIEYRAVVINGRTYFTDSGIYYVYTRNGYQVVSSPQVTVYQAPPVVVNQTVQSAPSQVTVIPTVDDPNESFNVNIPDDKGGYTSVAIRRSGQGYLGPQNEFYAQFPKVSQLKAMYVK